MKSVLNAFLLLVTLSLVLVVVTFIWIGSHGSVSVLLRMPRVCLDTETEARRLLCLLLVRRSAMSVRSSVPCRWPEPGMNGSKIALLLAGLFLGGAIDHVILAALGREMTPYRLRAGVGGNWALAVFDLALTALLFWLHRHLEVGRRPA